MPAAAKWAPSATTRSSRRRKRCATVIRANPGRFARVMLGRMGEMLNYAAAEAPTVLGVPPALADASRFLAPGRAAAPVRAPLGGLQAALSFLLLPLVVLGTAWLAWQDWRRTSLLLAISAYYLLSESP